jgi:hypothetical protein
MKLRRIVDYLRRLLGGRSRRVVWIGIFAFGISVVLLQFFAASSRTSVSLRTAKRLLEFGWKTPLLQAIPQVIDVAQTLPFDGLLFDIETPNHIRGLSWTVFGNQRVDQAALDQIAADLAGFGWGRLTDNFIRINVNYEPGVVDWFDDFDAILYNAEALARLANQLGFAGLMIDTEQYNAFPFDYQQQAYRDRYTYDEYADQAYVRGQEVMRALNRGYPGITILYTWGLTYIPQSHDQRALSEHIYGLMIPFLEGMIAAADAETSLVDAFEGAYRFEQEDQFQAAYNLIKVATRDAYTRDTKRYGETVTAGFGLWADHDCTDEGLLPQGCPGGFTPDSFKQAAQLALRYSDRYVWIYSERINWYTGAGIPPEWRAVLNSLAQ